jgi:hypothetical protein
VASPRSGSGARRGGSAAAPNMTDEQLDQMMKLMKGSDSVELKVTVPSSDYQASRKGLPIDPITAEPRQVYFFDTPDLDLNKAGIVVRARRIQGGKGDTVVKLRPITPDELSPELRANPAFKVEVDAMPGGFVCSGSFKGRTTAAAIKDALAGKSPIRKLFSKEQRKFFAEHVPAEIDLSKLVVLGPTFVLKMNFAVPEMDGRSMTAEMWLYQDGSRIVELSTKCLPKEAFQVATEARLYLKKAGLELAGDQQTKTKAALEFFQKQLATGAESA